MTEQLYRLTVTPMGEASILEALFVVGFIVFCGWAGWTNLGGPKR